MKYLKTWKGCLVNNMRYEYKSIGDLGKVITGKTPSTEVPVYFEGPYPFITPTDIPTYNERYLHSTERTISDLGKNVLKSNLLPKDTVCFVCIGSTIGKMCMTDCDSYTNQQINSIIPKKDIDSKYLFYLLRYIKSYFQSIGGGTGSGKGIVNKTVFSKAKVKVLVDKKEQEAISNILDKYDTLIELNNKRITLLEQTAEEIYKEWFARFRFPGYENAEFENGIPKGWERKKLKDLAKEVGKPEKKENRNNYNYYLPIDCIDGFSMSLSYVDSIENAESSLVSFDRGDILFGAMRPYFHKVVIAPFKGLTRTTCFVIKAREKDYRNYLYLLLNENASVNYATTVSVGSTMPYVRWKDFNRMNAIIPDKKTIREFNTIIEPILNRIIDSFFINRNIIAQRDYLLPRLMSGKLEV